MPEVKKGQRWRHTAYGYEARVMSDPIEGYVMARYTGAVPFLTHLKDWDKKFEFMPKNKQETKDV